MTKTREDFLAKKAKNAYANLYNGLLEYANPHRGLREDSDDDWSEYLWNTYGAPDDHNWNDPDSAKEALCSLIEEVRESYVNPEDALVYAGVDAGLRKWLGLPTK